MIRPLALMRTFPLFSRIAGHRAEKEIKLRIAHRVNDAISGAESATLSRSFRWNRVHCVTSVNARIFMIGIIYFFDETGNVCYFFQTNDKLTIEN